MKKQIELPAEEEDSGAVVFEAAESVGGGLYRLNLGVESFGQNVGDRMLEGGEQMYQMSFERASDLLHRFEFAAHDCTIPLREETSRGRAR